VFFAEINAFFERELGSEGYSGLEVRVTPMRTEIIIKATRTQNVLGEQGKTHSRANVADSETFQFPGGKRRTLC